MKKYVTMLSLLAVAILWQNCGEVSLLPKTVQDPIGGIASPESAPSVFKVPPVRDYEMRAAFFVDVSASMNTKSCPGGAVDIDTAPCEAESGYSGFVGNDSLFYRLHMIEAWIEQMDQFLDSRGLPRNKLKMIFIPFSSKEVNGLTQNPPASGGLQLYLLQRNFTSDRNAIKNIINTWRKMNYAFTSRPPDVSSLPAEYGLSPNMPNIGQYRQAAHYYIKTSIPAPALLTLKASVENEINHIRTVNPDLLSQTRFEIAFMSDGVLKPHHDDLKQAFNQLWNVRKIFRDYRPQYRNYRTDKESTNTRCGPRIYEQDPNACMCADQSYSVSALCQFYEEDFSGAGHSCATKCAADIDYLIENGVRKRKPKNTDTGDLRLCTKCIDSILDYMSLPTDANGGSLPGRTSFLQSTTAQWGDHRQNYAPKIYDSLRGLVNVFKDEPALEYRFNFIRFESANPIYKPTPYLLSKNRNWFTLAQEALASQHRYVSTSSGALPFSLFPHASQVNGYKLSHFFVLNPQVRLNPLGVAVVDSDADGLFDHEEDQLPQYDKNKSRTNGVCLDVIDFRFGGCVTNYCDPEIDIDGDGLNQCEEMTIGTSDTDWDTDNDGISDYFEVIYGFNPLMDDRTEDYNGDGVGNFINFTHGAGPWTNISSVPDERKVRLQVRETEPIERRLEDGRIALVPAYAFQLLSVPSMESLSAAGGIPTYYKLSKDSDYLNLPPILPEFFQERRTRLLLLGRVDHTQNYGDAFWIYQVIDVPYSLQNIQISIDLDDMLPMPWKDPVGGGMP